MGNKGSKVVEKNALEQVVENARNAVRQAREEVRAEEREVARQRSQLKKETYFAEVKRRCKAAGVKIQELTDELEELKKGEDQEKINEATEFLQEYQAYRNRICNTQYTEQHYLNLLITTMRGEEMVLSYPETPEEIKEEVERQLGLMTKQGGKRTRKGRKARRSSSGKRT